MRQRILITGANGLVAGHLIEIIQNQFPDSELFLTSKSEIAYTENIVAKASGDLTNTQFLKELILDFRPDLLFHTAAVTSVDVAEKEQDLATELNVEATLHLAKWSNQLKTRFIHYSTDFVFDGSGKNYQETDEAHPISHYGKTKLKSEEVVKATLDDALILRTILVYGYLTKVSRWNFPFLVIEKGGKDEKLSITADQYRTPIYATDLATASLDMVLKQQKGIFHLGGPEYLSVFQFAKNVAEVFELSSDNLIPVNTDSMNQVGRRPLSTGFNINKAKATIGFAPEDTRGGLRQMKAKIQQARGTN